MHPIEDGELISRYLDGEMDKGQVNLLEAHFRDCQPCSEEMALMHRFEALFSRAPVVTPSADFAERVLIRLEEREARRGIFRILPFLLIGSLLLASLFAFSLLGPLRGMVEGCIPLMSAGTKILMDGAEAIFSLFRASTAVLRTVAGVVDQRFLLLYSLTVLVVMGLWARLVGPRLAYSYKGG